MSGFWDRVARVLRDRASRWAPATWVTLAFLAIGCATSKPDPLQRYEYEKAEMGLPFRLVLYAPNPAQADQAAAAVWTRVEELNASLSDYETESELSRLSRTAGSGEWRPLSRDLAAVLTRAQQVSAASDGAFDVTVGPEVQLWRRARRQRELPSPTLLAAARQATGWTNLVLRQRGGVVEAQLKRPGMKLDLGGIAKGYALEESGRVLRGRGLPRFLISGSGDMVAGDPPPGAPGWKIEVGVVEKAGTQPPRFVSLRRAGLATSGDVFQNVEIDGVRYSHIVDPRTGVGLTDRSLVTVIAPDGMTADALSTGASVLGPARALELVRKFQAQVLVIRAPSGSLEVMESPGFRKWEFPP